MRPRLNVIRTDAVRIGREIAPKFDFPLLSKCLKPDLYGVQPVEEIAARIFAPESRRTENRALPYKHTWRCAEWLEDRLQIAKRAYGADCTIQEFITGCVLRECERIERKRGDAGE